MNKKDGTATKKQRHKLELKVPERVVSWTGLTPNDYNFRSWATARNQPLIRAGCVYEYARESRKLRCLLALINSAFQKAKLAEKKQKQGPPFCFLSWSFEGLRYTEALLQLGGWFGWLRLFTDQLADNTNFADLCEKNGKQVNDSLSKLPKFFLAPKAVEIALPNVSESPIEPRLLWPSQSPSAPHRNVENDVTVTIRIRLRDFNNREIGCAMEEFASMLRPSTEKEPTRRGTGKTASWRSWLDDLSAMRLRSHYPKTCTNRRKDERGSVTAIDIFDNVRLGKIGGVPIHSDLDEAAGRAQRQFERWFPFGDTAPNSVTWAQRQRRKQ